MASGTLLDANFVTDSLAGTLPSPPDRLVGDEPLYEIVNGERVELPPMSAYSVWIASRLHIRLGAFAEENGLGSCVSEMLFILDKNRNLRRRPHVAFVSVGRWAAEQPIPLTGDWDVVPDLAIEVVSPNDLAIALLKKVSEYLLYGVRIVWVIYPECRQVYVYRSLGDVRVLLADDELDGSDLLPGFRLALSKLFHPFAPAPAPLPSDTELS